jgi:2-polyprenyl-3-methyl-5-hydroxy-6-metoxy-1,4-benzoquinol methylase
VDPNPLALEQARKLVPEATVVLGTIEAVDPQLRFDLIILSHVLEHEMSPTQLLVKCRKLLTLNGKLLISVPNIESLEARVFGRYWRGLDIPRHTVHFRERVLIQLLEALGFSVLEIRPLMWAASISESFMSILPASARKWCLTSKVSRWFYYLMNFVASTSYLLGNRGVVEVVAQKSNSYRRKG